jgi:hypothetical protein
MVKQIEQKNNDDIKDMIKSTTMMIDVVRKKIRKEGKKVRRR